MGSLTRQLQSLEKDATRAAVMLEVERVCERLNLNPVDLKRSALFLLENIHLAPVLTPERLAAERGIMHAAAKRRCAKIGIDFEDVQADVDALMNALAQAAPGH